MQTKYSALCKVLLTIFIILVPLGVLTVWFDFLLLPISWMLSWLISAVIFTVGIYIFVLSKKGFDRSGQKLTPKAHGTSKLITTSIYSSIRHPHNLANMLINLGVAFAFKSTIVLIIALASIVVGYWFTLEEEKLLIQQFGERYHEYKSKVPMFIPKLNKKS